ncbi:MAG: dTDP-4-amino-4,6-dideoxygalactose transaminase [Pseudoalteromonas sp.]|uniref:dTDP-4-amino-4,6-dideoxygalactose transaminase n=1 Tax=Pseudoalteromonas sp. TaxID=53249 RepID=UPI000C9724BC|nr:dTDP-4-amino-4,6-dideoxygalactose transaminase [Pseudoalteromonas sp.]MAD02209.1 dTDP-4-amino-4,6-dideoxygalactose transaminase [Pseudoalteromonas sp.]|tara:strand:+ start:63917 stop:65047 length:1131 start_codon:yes stop_codon:yes gene_type:complete
MTIPFNRPYFTGNEIKYIEQVFANAKACGDGPFTAKCQQFFQQQFGFNKALLTTSCTDALEMAAILADIEPGDEVIAPSFTFVSSVNAFVLRGAKIVFADSYAHNPNIDADNLEALITNKTKAIVAVHYAGVACDMDKLQALCDKYDLLLIEDAAQCIDAYYKGKALGAIGDFGTFSFHETKNIISGEGGLLTVNRERFERRAEIVREKGTNRAEFFRGEVDKYGWVDVGSSFLPAETIAATLFAQLEQYQDIQVRRVAIWQGYYEHLSALANEGLVQLPDIPEYASNNAHMFYLVCRTPNERNQLIASLKTAGIQAVFHYQSLHKSSFYAARHGDRALPNADKFTDCLVRLPLFYQLSDEQVSFIAQQVLQFYRS